MPTQLTDPKIEVSDDLASEIGEIVCKEIKASLIKNSKIYDKAKRCENQYNQVTKWMAEEKTCNKPWAGAADYFVALSEWIVDAIFARLMSILFSQEPYMKAKGADSNSIPTQDDATEFVDMIFRKKIKLYDNINFFFKQMLKLPFAVLKYDWVQDYDAQIKKEQAITFTHPEGKQEFLLPDDPEAQAKAAEHIANGYQPNPEPQEVWTQNDVEIYDAPQLRYVKFEDYVWTPETKRGKKPYWEGDRCWFTINELQLKVKQEKFLEKAVEKIKEKLGTGLTGVDLIIKTRETPVECWHWWGRLPFNQENEIDFNDPDAIEQEVYCCVAYEEEKLLQILRWPYNRYPGEDRVYIRGMYEETDDFEGRSMLEKLYKTQQELNDFHNTLMNNAWIAMQKIFVKKKSLANDEFEKPKVFPGAMWEEEAAGDIRVLNVGDVAVIGMELEQTLLSFAERISNINNWNLGTQTTKGKGGKTATEFAGIMQEGNVGREPFLQRCYRIMTKICDWTIDYYKGRLPVGLERNIKDNMGNEISPTPDNLPAYQQKGVNPNWSEDNFSGGYDWTWQGTSQNADKQWNIMVDNELMDKYMPHPLVAKNLMAVWTILKKGLIDRGIKNWEEILPRKEAIQEAMKRAAEEAKKNAFKGRVVSRMVNQGMPADKANMMVKNRLGDANAGLSQ